MQTTTESGGQAAGTAPERGRRAWLLPLCWLAFAAAASWYYVVLPARHLPTTGGDFGGFHAAAGALLEGRSPYVGGAFSYPPLFALLLTPLATLPLAVARWAWFGLSLAALAGALAVTLRLTSRSTGAERGQFDLPPYLLATLAVWAIAGTVPENLVLGQVNPFLMLLIASAGALVAKRPAAAAALIAVAAAIKIWPGALLLPFLLRRQWKALATGIGTAIALSVAATAIAGAMVDGPLTVGEESVPLGTAAPLNISLPALALRIADPPHDGIMPPAWTAGFAFGGWEPFARHGWLSALVAIVVLATTALTLAIARRGENRAAPIELAVMTAAALLASPVTWYHYQLCQFPAMALVLARVVAERAWGRALALALGFVALGRGAQWLFGLYVDRWGWTGEAPAALWISTSIGPLVGAAWLVLLLREAARVRAR